MLTGTILLIEDNPDDVLITKLAFENNHLLNPIEVIDDGALVADYFEGKGKYEDRNIHDLPALVLLDLKLPNVSGLQVLDYIRNNHLTSLLPVIILTSSNEDKDVISSYVLGANSYVQKPVDFYEFTAAVKSLGLYWLVYNEAPQGRQGNG
jgi:two-component system, response regulator